MTGLHGNQAAFTLVELLVSMAILIMLVLMMHQALIMVGGAWSLGEANKERMQNVRAIGDFIGNELRAALLPVNRTSTTSLQFIVNPSGITPAMFNSHDSIFWQVPLASDQTLGDVAEIGYFVQWDASNQANPRARLCRFFVNHGMGATSDPNFLIYSNPAGWLSDTILQAVAPANKQNSYKGLFAENILGFWVQCLDPLGNPITTDAGGAPFSNNSFDSRRGYSYIDSSQTPTTVVMPPCALPSIINLGFVTLDSRSAARVGMTEQSAITGLVAGCADANAFVSRVLADSSLMTIKTGLRSFQTRIYLQESR